MSSGAVLPGFPRRALSPRGLLQQTPSRNMPHEHGAPPAPSVLIPPRQPDIPRRDQIRFQQLLEVPNRAPLPLAQALRSAPGGPSRGLRFDQPLLLLKQFYTMPANINEPDEDTGPQGTMGTIQRSAPITFLLRNWSRIWNHCEAFLDTLSAKNGKAVMLRD
ncbi:hypothetical protein BDW66DRAFT_151000 [Aspergillus desertorum]